MSEKISDLIEQLPFSEEFIIQKVKEINNPLEISSMFEISISQSNQLIKYIHEITKTQTKITKYCFSNQYDFLKKDK